ncbi:oxidation resistance protein 1 [Actinomortierella wolfii]|nr:oxidation resistance protein 1 [Actinomortierella wolfii]
MIPRKPKHMLSLVTTTDSANQDVSRTTRTTIHGGDWDDQRQQSSLSQLEQQQNQYSGCSEPFNDADAGQDPYRCPTVEPSTPSGPDPWMIVSGTGSSTPFNSAPASATLPPVLTPLLARQQQLQSLPTLQLLDRYTDTDPVLDVEVAQQVFGAFVSEAFKTNLSYYGTGECFLWNVTTLIPPSPTAGPTLSTAGSPAPSPAPVGSTKATPLPSPAASRSSTNSMSNSRTPSGASGATGAQRPLSADYRQELFRAMQEDIFGVGKGGRSPSPARHLTASPPTATTDALRVPEPTRSPAGSPKFSLLDSATSKAPASPSSTAATIGSSPPSFSTDFPTSTPNSLSTSATPTPTPVSATAPPMSSSSRKSNKQPRPKFVQFWKWTGRNDYMILSEPGFIGLGGGEGHFGLWIHADLEHGHSARCSTFDNEPLALACHRPIRLTETTGSNGSELKIDPTSSRTPTPTSASDASPKSDSDREKFYCQTIEIWAISL